MPTIEILGLIAAVLTTSAFVPQVYKAWRYKSTKDISLTMYFIFLIGVALWFVYGLYIKSFSMMVANGTTVFLAIAVIIAKIRFK